MNKKALVWGAMFGLIAPVVGLFVGLQISPIVANVLMFPIIGLSAVLGTPFGMWSPSLMLASVILSIAAWALAFALVGKLLGKG
jgi:hypothetical protein